MHRTFRSLASKALVIAKVQSAHAPAFAATRHGTPNITLQRERLRCRTPLEAAWASHRPLPKGKQAKLAPTTSAEWLGRRPCLSPEYGTTLCRSLHIGQSHQPVLPDQQQQVVPGIKAQAPRPVTNIRQRIVGYLRESLLLSYTALFDNVVFSAFEWLQLDTGLKRLTPRLEDGYASLTGIDLWLKVLEACISFCRACMSDHQKHRSRFSCRQVVHTSRWPAPIHIAGQPYSL